MTRKFFQIGFNKCGTTFLAQLFQINRIPAVHWLEGALAEDIAYSRLTCRAPLQKWADSTVAFTDMESVRYLNLPIVEAFKDYDFLDLHFPGAIFLLNTRRREDWVKSRYMHRGGEYARACARILNVSLADLGDIWSADWDAHLTGCRAYFAGRPEFVEIDIDHAAPADYRDALSPWFDLPKCPTMPDAKRLKARASYDARRAEMLAKPAPDQAMSDTGRHDIADLLAKCATPAQVASNAESPGTLPEQCIRFDVEDQALYDMTGQRLAIRRDAAGWYRFDPAYPRLLQPTAMANDIAQVTDRGTYEFDMRDGFLAGADTGPSIGRPILAPNRRDGAKNVFLWPASWLHRLGQTVFLGTSPGDTLAFEDKKDCAIWRGPVSGYAFEPDGADLTRPVAAAIGALLSSPENTPEHRQSLRELRRNSRVRFIRRNLRNADISARFLPHPKNDRALHSADLGSYLAARDEPADITRLYRYVICLGGTAGPENILPALNSLSVVLKETDGCEQFHTGLFRPWEHFIPLEWGANDLADKLRWARANPGACREISAKARGLCAALADPTLRRLHLAAVLRAYRRATGQPL